MLLDLQADLASQPLAARRTALASTHYRPLLREQALTTDKFGRGSFLESGDQAPTWPRRQPPGCLAAGCQSAGQPSIQRRHTAI